MTGKDRKAILHTGVHLNYATVDGITVVSNGHSILPMEPFFEATETEVVTPMAIEKYWRGLPERLAKAKPVKIVGHCKFGDLYVTRLSNLSVLNTGYLYLFDGCEIFSAGEYDPAIFVRNGSMAGAVMPMRNLESLVPCDAPTLEDIMASIRSVDAKLIRGLEEDIKLKREEIAALEKEIKNAEGEIAEIRSRKAEVAR